MTNCKAKFTSDEMNRRFSCELEDGHILDHRHSEPIFSAEPHEPNQAWVTITWPKSEEAMTPQQEADAVEELLDDLMETRPAIFDGFETGMHRSLLLDGQNGH